MSVIVNTVALKYRETATDPWQTLTIYTEKDIAAFADVFSPSSTYVVGEIVMHEGIMYKCTTAVTTAGAWTGSANWTETTVEAELASLRNTLNQLGNSQNAVEDAIAYVQDGDTASRTYTAGQFVYLKNHATLAEGLYTVNSGGIPSDTTVTGHLTADTSGGLNRLNDSISGKLLIDVVGLQNVNIDNLYGENTIGWVQSMNASGTQPSGFNYYTLITLSNGNGQTVQMAIWMSSAAIKVRTYANGQWSTWA